MIMGEARDRREPSQHRPAGNDRDRLRAASRSQRCTPSLPYRDPFNGNELQMAGHTMGIKSPAKRCLADLVGWLRAAPPACTLTAADVLKLLEELDGKATGQPFIHTAPDRPTWPWSALLWAVPEETRIGVDQLSEAVGRPRSWIYKHSGREGTCARLPHCKMDGVLVFQVGEVRRWLVEHEVRGL